MNTSGSLVVVHLGRAGARGNDRRVETWAAVARAADFSAEFVSLRDLPPPPPPARCLVRLARAEIVPESLTWSSAGLGEHLRRRRPDVVVFVTARTYDPCVVPDGALVVLDFVDAMSVNYAIRAGPSASLLRRLAFRCLTTPMARFERRRHSVELTTAAGRYDADVLGATWLPNVWSGPLPLPRSWAPSFDAVFHGSLRYEPNVEALEELVPAWHLLRRRRPCARLLVAGADPPLRVRELVASVPGWELRADFTALVDVLGAARIGIAPLRSASGFQNKVLECAAHGLPVVVSSAVARGLGADFPVLVADDAASWTSVVDGLLDERRAEDLGRRARDHVAIHHSPQRYRAVLTELMSGTRRRDAAQPPSGRTSP